MKKDKELDYVNKNCAKSVQEMINPTGKIDEFKSNNKEMCNIIKQERFLNIQ